MRSKLGTLAALLLCVASSLLLTGDFRPVPQRPFRTIVVGAIDAPPLYIVGPGGRVGGMVVDVINEAARRAGYAVRWRAISGEPDSSLSNGSAELYPTVRVTAERQKKFHMTEPWLKNRYCLVSMASRPARKPEELAGLRVAFWGKNAFNRELAHRLLPQSFLLPSETRIQTVEAVCRGEAVAGIIPDRSLETALLSRPPGCEYAKLTVQRIEGADSPLSLASRPENAVIADSLLDRIRELAEEGTLSDIVSQWSLFGEDETRSLVALRQSQRWNRIIATGLAVFAAAAVTLLWLLARVRRTAAALKREMQVRQSAQDAAAEAYARIEHQAYHDSLTGLANRLKFDETLREALALADYLRNRVALIYVDLDRFKQINDSMGHAAGDALLCRAAERLRRAAPPGSFLARLGGDEFAVVLQMNEKYDAVEAGLKLKSVLSEPFLIDGMSWRCPGSIGLSLYPDDARTAPSLQKNADTAMYRAKRTAPGQLVVFASHMGVQEERSAHIEQAIWRALADGAFRVHYQAQVDQSGALAGFEALVRLEDELLGAVSPSELIPVAEKTGSIVQIGEWILREACRQAAVWNSMGFPEMCMSVNLSAFQLCGGDFSRIVDDALARTGLPAHCLELEITETAIIDRLPEELLAIKRKGIRIAVDDFGTGYSSLGSLQRLPVDCVKIDRSFVSGSAEVPGTLPFIRAIVALARSLGIDVVAEGVETREQLEALQNAGCDRFQGYFFSMPLPEAEATLWLKRIRSSETGLVADTRLVEMA